ncbi:hypothetical protein [Fischerella sp. JS2]|nr:hypothetical protein [Fischerella sp. JS2]
MLKEQNKLGIGNGKIITILITHYQLPITNYQLPITNVQDENPHIRLLL